MASPILSMTCRSENRIMPSRPLQSCSQPGCGALVASGKCEAHKADRLRGTSAARGYDASHRKLRIECFIRDGWRCVECGWEPDIIRHFREFQLGTPRIAEVLKELRERFGRNETHLHADHKVRIDARPDLRLSLDNMQALCDSCHNRKSLSELRDGASSRREGGHVSASPPRAR
jgi:5-methylcytosine-specific restriction enzyme A